MKITEFPEDKSAAREAAFTWQHEFDETTMSWGELADWQAWFTELGERFDLTDEFTENGII